MRVTDGSGGLETVVSRAHSKAHSRVKRERRGKAPCFVALVVLNACFRQSFVVTMAIRLTM